MKYRSLQTISPLMTNCLMLGSAVVWNYGMWTSIASGQDVQVQQPVVNIFSVDTSVSVPDRGSVSLGGASSAQDSRAMYGPIPFGTSAGRSISNSSTRVHVYIHDFDWLDQQLLLEAERKLGIHPLQENETGRPQSVSQSQALSHREQALQILKRSRK